MKKQNNEVELTFYEEVVLGTLAIPAAVLFVLIIDPLWSIWDKIKMENTDEQDRQGNSRS